MGKSIKTRIIEASTRLFSTKPYEQVSVVQIVKEANVSNGVFYNYFSNKEALFFELIEGMLSRLKFYFQDVSGQNLSQRLYVFIEKNIEFTENEYPLIKIFRECQYTALDYELKVRDIYLDALKRVYKRSISDNEFVIVMGAIRYINIVYYNKKRTVDIEFLVEFLLLGLGKSVTIDVNALHRHEDFFVKFKLVSSKHYKILKKAMKLFSKNGYFNITVDDIMKKTKMSTGSFYLYYKSKEHLVVEIVDFIKEDIIDLLKNNAFPYDEDEAQLILYLYLVEQYYALAPERYRVIRDAEFIYDNVKDRHNEIEAFFSQTLSKTGYSDEEKRLIVTAFMGISHYIGIDRFFTKKIGNSVSFYRVLLKFLNQGSMNKLQ